MAGFHPAGKRVIGGRSVVAAADIAHAANNNSQQSQDNQKIDITNDNGHNHNGNVDEEDDIESDFSSEDYDNPYHETAHDWYTRHERRRGRRLAGYSSSSSSDDDSSISDDDSLENTNGNGNEDGDDIGSRRDREMERAIRSANKPIDKWLALYPFVAARCCLSSISSSSSTTNNRPMANNKQYYNYHHSNMQQQQHQNINNKRRSSREEETKRLRRILRRLHRKQNEIQAKYSPITNQHGTTKEGTNTNNASIDSTTEAQHQQLMESLLPRGMGISFIDAVLANNNFIVQQQQQHKEDQKTLSRLVLELNGPARSGMTSILLAIAARYVVSTSNIFIHGNDNNGIDGTDYLLEEEPRVVILDLEGGMHTIKLILSIRDAVLRRWEETSLARSWLRRKRRRMLLSQKNQPAEGSSNVTDENNGIDKHNMTGEEEEGYEENEQHQIELAIASCLGHIHIVQPRDYTYLSLVATIESLRHSLDIEEKQRQVKQEQCISTIGVKRKNQQQRQQQQQQPPTMILIDALTTLDACTRYQESLGSSSGNSSGLSDKNEFYRQLIRLREEHEVVIFGASRCNTTTTTKTDQGLSAGTAGKRSLWDKMVSHRISLHNVIEGTQEDRAGYDFVATLVNTAATNNSNNQDFGGGNVGSGSGVFPYSVTAGGIAC